MTHGLRLSQRMILDLLLRYWAIGLAGVSSVVLGLALALGVRELIVIIGFAGLVVLGITIYRPAYTAAVLVAMTWSYLGDVLIKFHGLPSVIKPTVALLALIIFARRFKQNPVPLVHDRTTWWFVAYVCVVWLGMLYAPYPDRVSGPAFDMTKDIVNYLIIINLLSSRSGLERTIWLLLVAGMVIGAVGMYQEATQTYDDNYGGLAQMKVASIANGVEERARSGGTIIDPNFYAQMMLTLVPFGLWATMHGRTWKGKLLGGLATAAIVGGVVLSFSRGGYLGLTVALLMFVIFLRVNPRMIALMLVFIPILFVVAPPEFQDRFSTLGELFNSDQQVTDSSMRGRSSYLDAGLLMFGDYPILGVGQGNYAKFFPKYISQLGTGMTADERDSHSLYIQVFTEHGLVGAILLFVLVATAWSRMTMAQKILLQLEERRLADLAAAFKAALIGYLVSATFLHDAFPIFLWIQVAFGVAIFVLTQRIAVRDPKAA